MKTMLITGTTQGIGKDLYQYYSGTHHVITINRREFGGDNFIADLSNIEDVLKITKQLSQYPVDIVINNAGGAEPKLFDELSADDLQKSTTLNYHAPVLIMQAVLKGMKERGYGRIVNISSIASKSPRELIPHYGAAKSALESFSSSIAVVYRDCNIAINCVCPGGIDTETSRINRQKMAMLKGKQGDYYNDYMITSNGLNRMINTNEVVSLVDFLIRQNAPAISGQSYNICGIKEVH